MFTRETLELIDSLLKGDPITEEERAGLQRIVNSALWASTRHLRAKERKMIEDAEQSGLVKRYGMFVSGIDPDTGQVTFTPKPPEKPSRLKPAAATAKTGEDLLKSLGL